MTDVNEKLEEMRKRFQAMQGNLNYEHNINNLRYDRMILLDVSFSMMGEKLTAAKHCLKKYIKEGDGLIVFGASVYHVSYPKIDTIMADGNTPMLPALKLAMEFKPSKILLITDGEANTNLEEDECPWDCKGTAEHIIDYLTGIMGVQIDTIGIGDNSDLPFLETVSEMTNGKFQYVEDVKDLEDSIKLLMAPEETAIAL